jgi:hypothetical protein
MSHRCGLVPSEDLVRRLGARLALLFGRHPPHVFLTTKARAQGATVSFEAYWTDRFRCSYDRGPFAECWSPYRPPGQDAGWHTLTVIADGLAGTSAPATATWRVAS